MTNELNLLRIGTRCKADGAEGIRGTITVGDRSFPTIERGDGYKWLHKGDYECELGLWTSKSGTQNPAIRVLGVYDNRIYIHPANWPHQLEGCIAPGSTQSETGVHASVAAMNKIFEALGGFVVGKKVRLSVGACRLRG